MAVIQHGGHYNLYVFEKIDMLPQCFSGVNSMIAVRAEYHNDGFFSFHELSLCKAHAVGRSNQCKRWDIGKLFVRRLKYPQQPALIKIWVMPIV